MTLITFQDGKVVLRDGKVGTEAACCCCPPGCPSLDGCNLVVTRNYDDFPIVDINELASNYFLNDYVGCQLAFSIADVPSEHGGDIDAVVTIGYDENCNPVVVDSNITYANADIAEFLVPLLIEIDCNPLP